MVQTRGKNNNPMQILFACIKLIYFRFHQHDLYLAMSVMFIC